MVFFSEFCMKYGKLAVEFWLSFTLVRLRKQRDDTDMCAIKDPLGQTHSSASGDHNFHLKIVFALRDFEKWRRTCVKIMITNIRHCGSADWIHAQKKVFGHKEILLLQEERPELRTHVRTELRTKLRICTLIPKGF